MTLFDFREYRNFEERHQTTQQMSGRQKTYSVELTQTEFRQLQQLVNARKSPQSQAKRAKIVLTSAEHADWTDAQVAEAIGCSPENGAKVAETLVPNS